MADKVNNKEGEKVEAPAKVASQEQSDKRGQRRRRAKPRDKVPAGDGDPFAPKHLSATTTPVVNDPLTDKCFFPLAGENLAPTSGLKYIYTGAEGMMSVATEEYTALVAHTYSVKRSISLSGYCYYAACLTWARMLQVDAANGGVLSFDERQFIDNCQRYKPPKILGSYLAGIGNTDHPNGFHPLRFRLKKPDYLNADDDLSLRGFFGNIRTEGRFYAAYPCIAVFALRILEDLQATRDNHDDEPWDLPDPFNYEEHDLTESCIGYVPAQPLDRAIVTTYHLCGISRNVFPVESRIFSVNYSLLNEIQLWIEEVKGLVSVPFPMASTGSRGQLLAEQLVELSANLKTSIWQSQSALRLSAGLEYAGSSFLYRVIKSYAGTGSQAKMVKLCPYVATYAEIPPNLNFLREAETDELLTVANGISSEYVVGQRLRGFMAADISLKTN